MIEQRSLVHVRRPGNWSRAKATQSTKIASRFLLMVRPAHGRFLRPRTDSLILLRLEGYSSASLMGEVA